MRPTWTSTRAFVLCGLAACVLGVAVPAQRTWSQAGGGPLRPPARQRHAMAYDPLRHVVVLYGGVGASGGTLLQDTWEWDGSTWSEVNMGTNLRSPGPLADHAMVFDEITGHVLLYGATVGSRDHRTWEWDGTTWTFRQTNSNLADQQRHAMAFDASRGRAMMVLDGGDTWEWNGLDWTRVFNSSAPFSGVQWPVLAYDSVRQRSVLFGYWQRAGVGAINETWEWDGAAWTQRFPTMTPSTRRGSRMVYDDSRGIVVLFGGYDANTNLVLADTWEWDGSDWTQAPATQAPPPRAWSAMAYDSQRGRPFMFGGGVSGSSGALDDSWEYLQPWPAGVNPYGTGCTGGTTDPHLDATNGSLPWVGEPFGMRLDSIGANPFLNVPFLIVGFSRTTWGSQPLPFDLSPFGMTGCSLLAEPALSFTLPNQGGFALWNPMLPNDPGIAGSSLFVQGGVTSFGSNPLGIVLSNGCDVAIGAR